MPSKKKKYNARFPAGRIKKIMQSDEEVGKVAQAVPVIISRTLELFVESLLTKTLRVTNARNAKTLSPSHMKQCIMAETQFDFLRELVKNVPDISVNEEYGNYEGSVPASPYMESPPPSVTTPITPLTPMTPPVQQEPYDLSRPSTSCEYNYGPKNFTLSSPPPPQKYPQKSFPSISMGISNGGQTNIVNTSIRNGNNNLSGDIISNNQTRTSIPSPSSSSTSSQGIEIVCKNSLIAKISIPSISPSNESNLSNKLITQQTPPPQEISPNIRSELKRPWDSMTRLRYPMQTQQQQQQQQPSSTITTGAASLPELYSSPATSSITIDSGPSPSKLSRLHSINQENQKQNITITPISLQNQGLMRHNYNDLRNSKELSNLSSLVTGAPVVKYDQDDTKPIINLDYSNIQLLPPPSHDRKINSNNHFQPQHQSSSSYSQMVNTNSLKNNGTSQQQSIQASDITNSPVINIDLSNIATQPPTININFNNLIKPTENSRSATTNTVKNPKITSSLCTPPSTSAITAAAVASIIPSTAAQLDLDEDYDNI